MAIDPIILSKRRKKLPGLWALVEAFLKEHGGQVHINWGAPFSVRTKLREGRLEVDFSPKRLLLRFEQLRLPGGSVLHDEPRSLPGALHEEDRSTGDPPRLGGAGGREGRRRGRPRLPASAGERRGPSASRAGQGRVGQHRSHCRVPDPLAVRPLASGRSGRNPATDGAPLREGSRRAAEEASRAPSHGPTPVRRAASPMAQLAPLPRRGGRGGPGRDHDPARRRAGGHRPGDERHRSRGVLRRRPALPGVRPRAGARGPAARRPGRGRPPGAAWRADRLDPLRPLEAATGDAHPRARRLPPAHPDAQRAPLPDGRRLELTLEPGGRVSRT